MGELPTTPVWWTIDLVTSIIFVPVHLIVVGLVFFAYVDYTDWPLYLWSGLQLLMAAYSFLLLLGTVPLQIVMLYLRLPTRLLCLTYISSAALLLTMTLVTMMVSWAENDITNLTNGAYTLVYQSLTNGPTVLFMVALFGYIGEIDTYIAAKYPSEYVNTGLF